MAHTTPGEGRPYLSKAVYGTIEQELPYLSRNLATLRRQRTLTLTASGVGEERHQNRQPPSTAVPARGGREETTICLVFSTEQRFTCQREQERVQSSAYKPRLLAAAGEDRPVDVPQGLDPSTEPFGTDGSTGQGLRGCPVYDDPRRVLPAGSSHRQQEVTVTLDAFCYGVFREGSLCHTPCQRDPLCRGATRQCLASSRASCQFRVEATRSVRGGPSSS
ncbi:hypothetical protein GWK47_037765 [Chionoecetes opilio]|uniref:Uncharacterized protein n=1 Tax=Chionoecetes opilio TaxID=41210 RepID=A0A8J5CZ54_CHIOP|nr:hypothetical protein GWK47_037765 [Chionoecetes opilio]